MPKSYINYCEPRKLSDKQREQAKVRMIRINSVDNEWNTFAFCIKASGFILDIDTAFRYN